MLRLMLIFLINLLIYKILTWKTKLACNEWDVTNMIWLIWSDKHNLPNKTLQTYDLPIKVKNMISDN